MKKSLTCLWFIYANLFAQPQAIIFDWGGVLDLDKPNEIHAFIQKSLQITSDKEFQDLTNQRRKANEENQADDEFWINIAAKKNISLPEDWSQTLRSLFQKAVAVNPEMFAILHQLKNKSLTVGLFSNVNTYYATILQDFGYYDLFNPCLLSYNINTRKPYQESYQKLLSELQLPAADVVFIDDKEENIAAAKKLGIDAILFQSANQIRHELEKRKLL